MPRFRVLMQLLVIAVGIFTLYKTAASFSLSSPSESRTQSLHAALAFETIDKHGKRVFSEYNEDGIFEYLFDVIGTTDKYYVEMGTQTGKACNSRYLREKLGWSGIMMDGGFENLKIGLHKEFLDAENIVGLFQKYRVPKYFDLLSIDIDGQDYYVLQSIMKRGSYRPRAIVLEYYMDFPLESTITNKLDLSFEFDYDYVPCGMSIGAAVHLLTNHEYTLVYCSGVNAFFIRSDVIEARPGLFQQSKPSFNHRCSLGSDYFKSHFNTSDTPIGMAHPIAYTDVASEKPVFFEGVASGWNGTLVKQHMYDGTSEYETHD